MLKPPARIADHPTVRAVLARKREQPGAVDAGWLREVCLAAGADDVAFASVANPELASEREHVEAALPGVRSYISLVVRMNRDNVRSTARSVANLEFHRTGEIINEAAHRITRALEDAGHRAVNPSAMFPMEMDQFPGRIWVVAHKPVAVAAGLGVMGIHRNVIHPKFGNFILLGTILIDAEITEYGPPLDYNPCLECKLCVAACPVGAIGTDGALRLLGLLDAQLPGVHGRLHRLGRQVADSKDALDYRAGSATRRPPRCGRACRSAELQGGLLPGGLPGGRGRHRALPGRPQGLHGRGAQPVAGEARNALRPPELGRRGARRRRFPHKPVKVVDSGIRGR